MKNAVQKCCMCSGFCIKQVWCLQLISLYISRHNYYVLISNFQNTEILSRIFLAMATYSSNWFGFFFLLCYFSFLCNFLYKREKAGKTFWFAYDTFYLFVRKYNAYFFGNFFEHTTYVPTTNGGKTFGLQKRGKFSMRHFDSNKTYASEKR